MHLKSLYRPNADVVVLFAVSDHGPSAPTTGAFRPSCSRLSQDQRCSRRMARRHDERHVAERTQVRREVGRRNRRDLDVELDVRRGLGRVLERRLERLAPRVVGDHHADAPDLTSLRELHDRLSDHGSSGQACAERVPAVLGQDLVVPRLHQEQRDLRLLRRGGSWPSPMPLPMIPPTETAPCCCVKPPKPVDGRGRVRGLVVRDGEVELPRPVRAPSRRPIC